MNLKYRAVSNLATEVRSLLERERESVCHRASFSTMTGPITYAVIASVITASLTVML